MTLETDTGVQPLQIEAFDPKADADAVAAWTAVHNASEAADAPWAHPETPASVAGWLAYGWDLEPAHPYLGTLDGETVVAAAYSTSEWDNTHLAWVEVRVHPDHRRRGRGTAMWEHLQDRARAEGRTSIGIGGWEGDGPAAFAAAQGLTPRLLEVNRRQWLAELDRAALDAAYADALTHAADYELVHQLGRSPEERLPAMAELTAAINDAPTDDLDYHDEVFTEQRIRDYETAQLNREQRLYRVYARHRETDALAGHTVIAVDSHRPTIGDQHDTAVPREHRGHRLGLLLKLEMLRWLAEAEPQLETIDTWNAGSNDHMIAVNELLGYRVVGQTMVYQGDL